MPSRWWVGSNSCAPLKTKRVALPKALASKRHNEPIAEKSARTNPLPGLLLFLLRALPRDLAIMWLSLLSRPQ